MPPVKKKNRISMPTSRPTTQDSLDLYNNSKKVINYYSNNKDYFKVPFNSSFSFKDVDSANDDFEKNRRFLHLKQKQWPINQKKPIKNLSNVNALKVDDYSKVEYRKNIDPNKFYQRENATGTLNLNAPMQLFDKRINPQQSLDFVNVGRTSLAGDFASVPTYDPIAVKPVSMLTPKERKEREDKYGAISKPKKKKETNKQVIPQKKEKLQPAPVEEPQEQPKVEVKPEIEPEVKPEVTPQETTQQQVQENKKLPGGTGSFAKYPKKQGFFSRMKDSFSGLMQNRKVNGRDVNNISVTGPSFVSGAKSVKQYRGDENLPEAKNGMKNCGCKHPKSKYKYQDGSSNVTSNEVMPVNDRKKNIIKLLRNKELLEKYGYAYNQGSFEDDEDEDEITTPKKNIPVKEKIAEKAEKVVNAFKKKSSVHNTSAKLFKFADGNKNVYIPFSEMQPFQQNEYRMGMQQDSDFNVTNIGKYAKPTKAQKELSARMDAEYKALMNSKKSGKKSSQKAAAKQTQNTPTQIQQTPTSQTATPIQAKPTAPVVTKPTEDSWTENQWNDFLKKRNNVAYVKPTPYIPVAKAKPAATQVVAPQPKPKVKSRQQVAGKFLDPKSVGVLMSQQGPAPKPLTNLKDAIYNFPAVKAKARKLTQVPIENIAEDSSIIDTAKASFNNVINNTKRIINDPIDVKKAIKDSLKENLPDGDIKETILNNPVSSWPSLAASAIRRNWAKSNPEDERTATIKVPDIDSSSIKSSEKKSKVVQRPDVYITGDTLQDKGLDRRYHVPEIIDLDSPNITYGTRSRGEYNEIETEGAPITSAYPFISSKQYFKNSKDPSHTDYIGIDSKGKIKIGKKNDFQDDDYQLSKTYIQNVESFDKLMPAIGNKNFQSPQVNIVTDSGVKMKTNLNFLVPKGDTQKAENTFDEVSGGRYIFETPDKKKRILVSGSLKTIKETFDKMKKDNPYLRVVSLDNGSYAKGIRTFDQKLTAEDLRTYDAQNPVGGGNIAYIKSRPKKYKYGTGALEIPEGSAIVTANGGKNKQALKAYKKGNYKLLNKIIDGMPEDRVSKKAGGTDDLKSRYQYLAGLTGPLSEDESKELGGIKTELTKPVYDFYDDKRIAEKFGQKYDVDRPNWRSSLQNGNLNLKENDLNVKHRERLRTDPKFFEAEKAAGRVTIDKNGNIAYKPVGNNSTNKMEFLGTSKAGTLPDLPPEGPATIPGKPPGKKDDGQIPPSKKGYDFPSMAEVAARSSILGQGVENVPEYYLNLNKYNYASQLPKTLQENSLAAQSAMQTTRDAVGGDVGRYLAQGGNITSARIKGNNEAVIEDTLARQDILNKNVDLSNVENQTNRGLRDQYAQQRSANRGAYNNQLIATGQGIDTAVDASKLMKSQRNVDDVRTNLLKSGNYYMDKDGNVHMNKAKGSKKLKTYKRK